MKSVIKSSPWWRRPAVASPVTVDLPTDYRTSAGPLPTANVEQIFPGIEQYEVRFPVATIRRPADMLLPLPETLTLSAICQFLKPGRIFEIGTYTGESALSMAMNVPPTSELFTLDWNPAAEGAPSRYKPGAAFAGTKYASMIRQLHGNSRDYDFSSYWGTVDFVFIDADHSYEAVASDTQNALRMLKPQGVLMWDDYLYEARNFECAGVGRFLADYAKGQKCTHIAGTRLAVAII